MNVDTIDRQELEALIELTEKYDGKAKAIVALNKYLLGVPLYRLAFAQKQLGVPLPAGTQYQLIQEVANILEPIHAQLLA